MHADNIVSLIDTYGIDRPVQDDDTGAFETDELQATCHHLAEQGGQSLLEALKAGAIIEEADMRGLHETIGETDSPDIDGVYEIRLRGSRKHLRALVDVIESLGVVHAARLLTPKGVDAIVDSDTERGWTERRWRAPQGP